MEFLKQVVRFQDQDVEVIKVIFALAFNLNIQACISAEVNDYSGGGYASSTIKKKFEYYTMTLDFKSYWLSIDEKLNIAGADGKFNADYPPEMSPISNQLKIAFFLINNNFVPDIIRQNLEII